MRYAWLLGLGLVLGLGSGCESSEQKCANARAAALNEWDAYLLVLEEARTEAASRQRMAGLKLMGIDARLAPRARALADTRYPQGSEAWLRANTSAHNELCGADPECKAQREQRYQADDAIKDLDERLTLVRAARNAAEGDAEGAKRASAAVILHPEFPQLKQAQALSGVLVERCAGLPADAVSAAR